MARFTITINATLNGKTCKNPQIEFIQGSDVIYPCEISGNQITIETLPGTNPNACIEGYIKCDDDCLNCPPQYFKKCLCNDVTLLNSCQVCKDGLIEEICTPEEIAAGKVCGPNGCVCPPDKPVTDPNTGQCVQCITGTKEGCKICVGGVWTTLECGPNERCVDGGCECIPPYVKDPLTGECKLQDECLDDADCPTCQTCILGKCEPVKCPEGFQCINDECVPACANENCNNGADCGENCGCLDGKCVPCSILSCLDQASCQAALGCKCNGDKCTPVDNCDQSCEDAPCIDPGCTCYNGKCVSCENFPCVETDGGCNSYYNCQCNDQGKCEGGKDCEDTFTLTKKESCSGDGCELEAVYNTKNKCMCDAIEFRVSNTFACLEVEPTPDDPPTSITDPEDLLLRLHVQMFKKGVEYRNFKTNDKFSDTEIVTGSIKILTKVGGVNIPAITQSITGTNTIPVIDIRKPTIPSGANGSKVQITVLTQAIRVNDNGCTEYSDRQIAYYEFDLSKPETICNIQRSYKLTKQIARAEDPISTKKPLIVWYRTSGNDFGNTFIDVTNSTNYAAKGYFRKKYLTSTTGSFSDKIVKPEEGLLNNFRYKVTIDCGCEGANEATTGDVVIFCCPKEYEFATGTFDCGKTVKLKPFTNCSVNGNLNTSKYPLESITKYSVSINGKDGVLLSTFSTVNNFIEIKDAEPIKSLAFSQIYGGNAVVKKACEKSYNFSPVLPDFNIDTSLACSQGVITVDTTNSTVNVSSLGVKLSINGINNLTLTAVPNTNNKKFTTPSTANEVAEIKKGGTAKVTVNFEGGCVNMKEQAYTCQPNINTDAEPNQYAKATCSSGGDNPKIVVTPTGFGSGVVYSLNGGAFQSSNEFLNVPAGTYTVTAKETINGIEFTATSTIVIEPAIAPAVTLSPSNICVGGSSTLTITGVPGSVFTVSGPSNTVISTVTLNASGTASIPNLTLPGNYSVLLNTGAPDKSCPSFSDTVVLSVGGQQLTPTIEIQPGNYCVGQPVPFRILDGGANETYNLSTLGTGTITSPLQANQFAYNGVFTPSSASGFIKITGVDGTCNTTTNPQISVSSTVGPVITSATAVCQTNNQHTVTVVATGATSVTIGGVAATNTSTNTWQRTNITGLTEVQVVVSNGSCEITQTVSLPNCLCPTGEVLIASGGDTCGQGLTNVYYTGSNSIAPNTSWTYIFQNFALGEWGNVGVSATFNPLSLPNLSVPTTIGVVDQYRLKLINTTNGCEYFSDSVNVTAVNPPFGVSINSTPSQPFTTGVPITFSTISGYESYVWSGDVTGSTSTANPVSFTTPGFYQATVTVCSAPGCCVTENLQFEVVANCVPAITFGPATTPSCGDITISVSGGVGTRTYTVGGTYINVVSTNVPANNIITIPTIDVPADETDTLTLVVTDSNGCSQSIEFDYTRCSCICNSGVCGNDTFVQTILSTPVGTPVSKNLGYFTSGTEFNWILGSLGRNSMRAVVKLDNVIIFDTGFVTRASTACGLTGCEVGIEYLGDSPSSTVTLSGGTGETGVTSALDGNPTCDALNTNGLTLPVPSTAVKGFFAGTGANVIQLLSGGEVTIEVTKGTCSGSGGSPTVIFGVSCN